ncbi:MAG: putative aminopeptidase, partial [Cellvibrionaceae bacterium]
EGDSRFNEAFASATGELGTLHWLEMTQQRALLKKYQRRLEVREDFLQMINETKKELVTLYRHTRADEEKQLEKMRIFNRLREKNRQLQQTKWNGERWYDGWFRQPINNAHLVAIGTYRDLVPNFLTLFERCQRNFEKFYRRAEDIAKQEQKNFAVKCHTQ